MVPLSWGVLSVLLFWRPTKAKEENSKNVQLLTTRKGIGAAKNLSIHEENSHEIQTISFK